MNQASQPPQKTVSHVLGEIAWLLTQSQIHKYIYVADLETLVMPAILLEQFRIYPGPNGAPGGVVLWASVSNDADARLSSGHTKLAPHEWRSGDHLWLVELIAPFGGVDEMLAEAAQTVFAGKPFKYHRAGASGVEVVTYEPAPSA